MKNLTHIAFAILLCAINISHAYDYKLFNAYKKSQVLPKNSHFTHAKKLVVIDSLRTARNNQQAELAKKLSALEKNKLVHVKNQLWLANIIVFYAKSEVVQELAQMFSDYNFAECAYDFAECAQYIPAPAKDWVDSALWNLDSLKIQAVRKKFGVDGDNVLVGIFDSGVGPHVPDVAQNVFTLDDAKLRFDGKDNDANGYVDDVWGYVFCPDSAYSRIACHPYDDRGHGTHVAGTICGVGRTGIAPAANFLSLKVLNDSGSGYESSVWSAIQYAVENNVQVGNFSIGWRHSSLPNRPAWRELVSNAIELGLVCCIAAGNEGIGAEPDNLRTPGDLPEVISVGAVTDSLSRATFSSCGPVSWDDFPYPPGLTKPDVVLPGTKILSCVIPGGLMTKSGTSMACPHATAIASLIVQLNPELSHYEIKNIIETCAKDLGVPEKDNEYGEGFPDVFASCLAACEMCTLVWNSLTDGILRTLPHNLKFQVAGDTIIVPRATTHLIFESSHFAPETLHFDGYSTTVTFAPSPVERETVRVCTKNARTGENIFALWINKSDTVRNFGCVELEIPRIGQEYSIVAPNFEIADIYVLPTDECVIAAARECVNFESEGYFIASGDWQLGLPSFGVDHAYSGVACWATVLADTYHSIVDTLDRGARLKTRPVFVKDSVTISFAQYYDTEATDNGFWDGGTFVAWIPDSDSSRVVEKVLIPIGEYSCHIDDYNTVLSMKPAFAGTLACEAWHKVHFALEVTRPCSVEFELVFATDNNTTRAGWFIDDFLLEKFEDRRPCIYNVRVAGAQLFAEIFADSTTLANVHVETCDGTETFAGNFVGCDEFLFEIAGHNGDTLLLRVVAEDLLGRKEFYPVDSCITMVVPETRIIERDKELAEHKIFTTASGIHILDKNMSIEIYDFLGRKTNFDLAEHDGMHVVRPKNTGVYFIKLCAPDGTQVVRKILWVE